MSPVQPLLLLAALWLWGKTDRYRLSRNRGGPAWNSLLAHCLDTAAVCGALIDEHLAAPTKAHLADAFGAGCPSTARRVLMLLAALHDMPGKAVLHFQQLFAQVRTRDTELAEAGRLWALHAARAGIPLNGQHHPGPPHAHVTARYLPALLGCLCPRCTGRNARGPSPRNLPLHDLAAILGGHHGDFPDASTIRAATLTLDLFWRAMHRTLTDELARLLGVDLPRLPALIRLHNPITPVLLGGLVVHSDWIASNEHLFTYRTPDTAGTDTTAWWQASQLEATAAVSTLRLHRWTPRPMTWAQQMPTTPHPRPAQQTVIDHPPTGPSLVIIEDTTGGGKSETASYLTHHLALTCGYHGSYTALPLRAAGDQLAERTAAYLTTVLGEQERAHLAIVHGNAFAHGTTDHLTLTDSTITMAPNITCEDHDLHRNAPAVVLDHWYIARTRGLLSCFGVGTIDQLVLAAQRGKHWFLRLYGLANKTVVIDEAHAYALYQQRLLAAAIAWLATAGSSVVVLSATLPAGIRRDLVNSWCRGHRTTPTDRRPIGPITITDTTGQVRTHTPPRSRRSPYRTRIRLVTDPGPTQLAHHLLTRHPTGITTVILNTVTRAEDLHRALRLAAAAHGWEPHEIKLLHSRYQERDRARHQHDVENLLGPHPDPTLRAHHPNPHRPGRLLLVGTQVLEQSLDYDTDHLYTDLAPLDLLLQRRGRQWRHPINRRHKRHLAPLTHVLWTPRPDSLPHLPPPTPHTVYHPYILAATWHALTDRAPTHAPRTLNHPDDTQPLLDAVYSDTPPAGSRPIHQLLAELHPHWIRQLQEEDAQAAHRVLWPYDEEDNATSVSALASGPAHETFARSRLGTPSTPIVALYQHPDSGRLTWTPTSTDSADLTSHHPITQAAPYRAQRLEIHRNTIPAPTHWFTGSARLPAPDTWTLPDAGALADRPVLLMNPDGKPIDPRLERLNYDPETGLSLRPEQR
ncbi:CRISPR-associated helicase Cas3' [Streptomyces erythrochromogenes]|uniref:CRISPR-associated helicase Cas3' n=1 Tax=Streptomyces erythrochromogenes TaxID=285574 RepID=UPI00369F3975